MLQGMQERKINIINTLPIITMAVLSVVLFCGNVFVVNTSKIVDLICIVSFPFFNVSGLMMMTAFLIPVNSGITTLYIFGYIAVLLIVKDRKFNLIFLLSLIAIVAYELVLIAVNAELDVIKFVQYAEVLFLFIYGLTREKLEYKKICYSYILGVVILLVAVLATASQTYGFEEVINGEIRIGYNEDFAIHGGAVAFIQDNANNIGYYSVLASTMCVLLAKNAKWAGKTLLWASFVLIVLIAAFTVSRTWLFLTMAGIVLAVLFGYKGKAKIGVLIALAAIVALVSVLFLSESAIVESFTGRLNQIDEDNRGEIALKYLDYLGNNPLVIIFGTGAIDYRLISGIQESLHFGFLQILVSYGVFGFGFWMWLMFSPIWKHCVAHGFKIGKLVPVLVVLVFVQTIQFLNPYVLMLPFMIAVCYMKIPERENPLEAK